MHWIVYEGDLQFVNNKGQITDNLSHGEYLNFKLFTWGVDVNKPILQYNNEGKGINSSTFKSQYYGYMECWD